MAKTTRLWPYIRAIAKALTVPGANIGLSILTDIQDQLSADEFQRDVNAALDEIRSKSDQIATQLASQENIHISASDLSDAALHLADTMYRDGVADKYYYADFKGIEQLEKFVSLKLDDIFVNLKIRPEGSEAEQEKREREMRDRLAHNTETDQDLERQLAELDVKKGRRFKADAQPLPIDRILAKPGGAVLLGGPGSGKTTLVKRLARSCALGPDATKKQFPELPPLFPIVIPITMFDHKRTDGDLFDYIRQEMNNAGGEALVQVFQDNWAGGGCLILLDGLDEVVDTRRRVDCARAVGELFRQLDGNRALATSRPVGYSICRINVPAEHLILQSFEPADIETFARQWQAAYEQAIHPETPDLQEAQAAAQQLIDEIRANPRVESLAANPLMLTIIALIKHQNITLPERRVELYEIVLNTLIRSWNKARNLAGVAPGSPDDIGAEETKKVWGKIAFWMHTEKSTGTCHRQELHDQLVETLIQWDRDELDAERIAESYLAAAAERAGLLEERGTNIFAFMHQTFQEYLAARHLRLARPQNKAIERIVKVAPAPRWHEVVRLAAGFIGVIKEEDEPVTELVTTIAAADDPLEPYLCTGLRLAASCIADDVRVDAAEADKIVAKICVRIEALPYEEVIGALTESLESMRHLTPGPAAVEALLKLTKHRRWKTRMEAVRMLSRAAHRDSVVVDHLRKLFETDDDVDVRAHAALGLWQTGVRQDDDTAKAIAHGLQSSYARMKTSPATELVSAMLKLLEDDDADVRSRAAEVLGGWGPQADAMPAMLKRLENDIANVRTEAMNVLAKWGGGHGAAKSLLEKLIPSGAGPAVAYLERTAQGEPQPPEADAAQLLARAIKPDPHDSKYVTTFRETVFAWLWQASQRGDSPPA